MGKRGLIQRSDAPRGPCSVQGAGRRGVACCRLPGCASPCGHRRAGRPRGLPSHRAEQGAVRWRWCKCSSAPPAPVCTRCSHGNFAESRMRPHCWTRTRVHTHAHARTHARTLTHAHTCSHVHTRAHTFTHARTDTLTHTCGRTCTHAHRHTLTHGRVRTRTQRCGRQRSRWAWARSIRAEGRPR